MAAATATVLGHHPRKHHPPRSKTSNRFADRRTKTSPATPADLLTLIFDHPTPVQHLTDSTNDRPD
ncbi:hypothetical protein OIO89_01130 (plasmid) [Mycobacterium ulcerans]|nr:hypothetical protein OIO89_01130 [Mycobacterium ulcerans]